MVDVGELLYELVVIVAVVLLIVAVAVVFVVVADVLPTKTEWKARVK